MSTESTERTEVHVAVDSEGLVEQVADLAGAIVIPVADLPAGSVVTVTISVGPATIAAGPAPAPEIRARPMMGTGRR